jgi:hypothetical protein
MNLVSLLKNLFCNGIFLFAFAFYTVVASSQNQMATYAGNTGFESFNDVAQLSNGHYIVAGAADNLDWISASVPVVAFVNPGITNATGTSKIAFLLEFDSTLQNMLKVYHLPVNAAEDFRFIKTTNIPGQLTGSIYISGTTSSGYFIGKLDNNFTDGSPSGFAWIENINAVAAEYPKVYQPWDVGGDGKVVYAMGDSHNYNWSAIYRLKADGTDDIVEHWRVHWKVGGGEFYGNASDAPGGISGLLYSGIVFKRDPNRCELRSTNQADYDLWQPDGNGGTKKGKWPLDVLYNAPCTPGLAGNSTTGQGYTGYSPAATFTYGPSSIAIDKRNNAIYVGFNAKSTLPSGEPDFEPAVMAMDSDGELLWWSRLYHEKRADGTLQVSSPDQYIDALSVDYSLTPATGNLVVGARCHGNNIENFWEGNAIVANPSANGFQNNFTGSSGNIHISWIGKLSLSSGILQNSTYMAECADQTTGLGTPHIDPNLDGWPDPNTGWPNVNTTYLKKNMMKITADGSVVVLGIGRRTITTANAYQKMIKQSEGSSSWNDFIRVYMPDLSKPLYSSILTGEWDHATGAGGSNVTLQGIYKTSDGVIAVGFHIGSGNQMPVTGIPSWGNSTYSGSSAVLVYLKAANLINTGDGYNTLGTSITENDLNGNIILFPNPSTQTTTISVTKGLIKNVSITAMDGKVIFSKLFSETENSITLDVSSFAKGIYLISIETSEAKSATRKLIIR